jgi:hypothetical protein
MITKHPPGPPMTVGNMRGGALDALLVPSGVECGKYAPGCRWVDRRGSRF